MRAKYVLGALVTGCSPTRHGSMAVDPHLRGRVGEVIGNRTLHGDSKPFYMIQYRNGEVDYADEDCLRRA